MHISVVSEMAVEHKIFRLLVKLQDFAYTYELVRFCVCVCMYVCVSVHVSITIVSTGLALTK